MIPSTRNDTEASARAERQADIHFDFELEDIIAGNAPASEIGAKILSIVENGQELPTQGKIEAALIPLYEAMTAELFSREGGTGDPPPANRRSVREHAVKVIQARKVKRTAMLRAARGPGRAARPSSPITGFQLAAIALLAGVVLLVVYFKS
jgi:hypothetical protein